MKRLLIILCAVCLSVLLAGCAQQTGSSDDAAAPADSGQAATEQAEAPAAGQDATAGEKADTDATQAASNQADSADPATAQGALPAWKYPGENPYAGALCDYMLEKHSGDYSDADVFIPVPVLYNTDDSDKSNIKVQGTIWVLGYVLKDTTLVCTCGGEYSMLAQLAQGEDGSVQVVSVEEAGDGSQYAEDVKRFADGNAEVEEAYLNAGDIQAEATAAIRSQLIKDYVEANNLNVTAYQDEGWNPVTL